MVLTNLYRVYGTKDNNRTDDFARDMHWLHGLFMVIYHIFGIDMIVFAYV
jgi:hypothetical protein